MFLGLSDSRSGCFVGNHRHNIPESRVHVAVLQHCVPAGWHSQLSSLPRWPRIHHTLEASKQWSKMPGIWHRVSGYYHSELELGRSNLSFAAVLLICNTCRDTLWIDEHSSFEIFIVLQPLTFSNVVKIRYFIGIVLYNRLN